MQLKSKPKRKSCPLMRLRLVGACVDGISRLMFWRQPEPVGVPFEQAVHGDIGAWVQRSRQIVPPLNPPREHFVLIGKDPEGKTSASVALANAMMRQYRAAQMFFLDWEANEETTRVFGTAVTGTGRTPLFFPHQPFNIWAGGDWRPVLNRLLVIFRTTQSGSAAYYRNVAELILQLACRLNGKSPQSLDELLERLDYETLLDAFGEERLAGIKSRDVEAVHARCKALFRDLGVAFDGERSFATLDAAHFNFGAISRRSGVVAARVVLAQLRHYIQYEKDPERLCFVFVRMPVEVAGDADLALLLEGARHCGVVVVLVLQRPDDAGSQTQLARILNNVGTVIAHSGPVRHGGAAPVTRADLLGLGFERVYLIKRESVTLVEVPGPLSS